MRDLLIDIVAFLLFSLVCCDLSAAEPIKRLRVEAPPRATATPPQALVDAMAAVEADHQAAVAADLSLTVAQTSVDAAVKQKSIATAALATDTAAFLTLWAQTYGPVVPPPMPTPTPPAPTPTPPEPDTYGVTMVELSFAACVPCQTLKPVIDSMVADGLPIVVKDPNTDPDAKLLLGSDPCPTMVTMVDGKEVSRAVVAGQSKEHLAKWFTDTVSWVQKQKGATK